MISCLRMYLLTRNLDAASAPAPHVQHSPGSRERQVQHVELQVRVEIIVMVECLPLKVLKRPLHHSNLIPDPGLVTLVILSPSALEDRVSGLGQSG